MVCCIYQSSKRPDSNLVPQSPFFSSISRYDSRLNRRELNVTNTFFYTDQDTRKLMTPLGEVGKVFPRRGSLYLNRLVKLANFTCSRCSLKKKSKLVAYAEDSSDEPLCNGCYGSLLSNSKKQGEAL